MPLLLAVLLLAVLLLLAAVAGLGQQRGFQPVLMPGTCRNKVHVCRTP